MVAAWEASDQNLAPGGAHPAQLWTTAQLGDRLFLEALWVGLMDSRLGKGETGKDLISIAVLPKIAVA